MEPSCIMIPVIEPPLKKQGFVSQDHIRGFLSKREYTNTTHKAYKIIYMKFE
jgi:hypothetical protein